MATHPLLSPLALDNLDNIGLKKHSTLSKFFDIHPSIKQKFTGMQVNHESFQKTVKGATDSPFLTEGSRDLKIGLAGEKIMQGFTTQADALMNDLKGLHNAQESSLYSNATGLSPQQLQLIGVIGDQFMKDGLEKGMDYLADNPFVEAPITFLAKAGVLGKDTSKMIIEKMDMQHSPDVLDSMKETAKAIEALENTVQEERYIIEFHSPVPKQMEALKASKASAELQASQGF